ncbi:MAG: serine/threonine protein phosphatase [Gemmatimonas sp. SG8_23]|nr:MAG: serine/threonine protein phosphatase [Gemmatimonas sp. SG8_23]
MAACAPGDESDVSSDARPRFVHEVPGPALPWTHEDFDSPSGEDDRLTFALFADLTGGERSGVFDVAIEQLNLLRPELIVNVGDLIEGDSDDPLELAAQWDAFDERARRARAPIFYVGGNHDLTGDVLRGVWAERYGPTYYWFRYDEVLFLVLDTEDNTPERMAEIEAARVEAVEIYRTEGPEAFAGTEYSTMPERTSGTIGATQSAYFVEAITANPDVRWTFVLTHKPAWQRQGEQNFAAIEAALSGRSYTVFSGHVQAYAYEERHGRDYVQLATTGGLQFPDLGRSADHVTIVTVDDGGVDIATLLLDGILDRTGVLPAGGDTLCFEAARCGT